MTILRKQNPLAILLGTHLKNLRIQYGFQKRTIFSQHTGIPYQTIYDYEAGNQFPSIDILLTLYNALRISFEEIFEPLIKREDEDPELRQLLARVESLAPEYRNALKVLITDNRSLEIRKLDLLENEEKSEKRARGSPSSGQEL